MKDQYDKAVKAYSRLLDLGVSLRVVPSLSDIEKAITPEIRKFIDKEKAELVITPAITKEFSLYDLIDKFDTITKTKSYIYHNLWDKYDFIAPMKVSFVAPGLKYTNKTLSKQRELLKKNKEVSITAPEYVMLQLIHKNSLLDKTIYRRLVDLPSITVGGRSLVGGVDSDDGRFGLDWSNGYAYPDVGVGLSVGLDLDFKTSPSLNLEKSLYQEVYDKGWNESWENIMEILQELKHD